MATSSSWMPSGRHEVTVGPSLIRALKARKSAPVKNTKQKPDRELYSFRYNFKPESIDHTKPGTVEIRQTNAANEKDRKCLSSVTVVRPSTQHEHGTSFVGQENAAREYECLLIYDEETGTFSLEKVESFVLLNHEHKTVHLPRYPNSPAPPGPPRMSASSSSSSGSQPLHDVTRQEEEESEGEIPETKPQPSRPSASTASFKAKAAVPAQTPPVPASQPVRSSHAPPPKPSPAIALPSKKARAVATPTPTSTAAAPAKGPGKRARPPEEETLEIRRPVQPAPKKPKVVQEKNEPPPKQPFSLSLPDSSALVSLPSALAPPPVQAAPPAVQEPLAATSLPESDEEEEWDDVPAAQISAPPPIAPVSAPMIVMEEIDFVPTLAQDPAPFIPPPIIEPESEEIDMRAFEEELNDQLGDQEEQSMGLDEDEDFLAGAVSPVAERQPVSLSQYAGGGGVDFGDEYDDFSSSDGSDDSDDD